MTGGLHLEAIEQAVERAYQLVSQFLDNKIAKGGEFKERAGQRMVRIKYLTTQLRIVNHLYQTFEELRKITIWADGGYAISELATTEHRWVRTSVNMFLDGVANLDSTDSGPDVDSSGMTASWKHDLESLAVKACLRAPLRSVVKIGNPAAEFPTDLLRLIHAYTTDRELPKEHSRAANPVHTNSDTSSPHMSLGGLAHAFQRSCAIAPSRTEQCRIVRKLCL